MKKLLFFTTSIFILTTFSSCSKNGPLKKGTCSNGIQNQNETAIDCGGPCTPCPTCSDGILNQDEITIDCGGKCLTCPSCNDGLLNQGETDVDCGGPCGKCPIVYPEASLYGINLLSAKVSTVSISENCSFMASIPEKNSLKVILKNTGKITLQDPVLFWNVQRSPTTWTMTANGLAQADATVSLAGSGSVTVEYYENEAAIPTRTKTVRW